MAYTEYETDRGTYMVDHVLVSRIAESCAYSTTLLSSARVETRASDSGIIDRVFGLPSVSVVKSDHRAAVVASNTAYSKFISNYRLPSALYHVLVELLTQTNMAQEKADASTLERMRDDLWRLERDGIEAKAKYRKMWDECSGKTMRSIKSNVARLESNIETAQFIRDASIDTFVIAVTIHAGPAATLAKQALIWGGNAVLKGGAKYQDTGNVGASVLTTGMEFLVGAIPGGNGKQRLVMWLAKNKISFTGNVAIGLLEGKTITDAAKSSAIQAIAGLPTGALGDKLVNESLEKMVLPGLIVYGGAKYGVDSGKSKLDDGQTKQLMQSKKPIQVRMPKRVKAVVPNLYRYAILGPDACYQR